MAGYHTWRRLGRQVRQGRRPSRSGVRSSKRSRIPNTPSRRSKSAPGFVLARSLLRKIWSTLPPIPCRPSGDNSPMTPKASGSTVSDRVMPLATGSSSCTMRPGVLGSLQPRWPHSACPEARFAQPRLCVAARAGPSTGALSPRASPATRDQRELEAESAAMIVAAMFGLEHPTARDYILSYQGNADGFRRHPWPPFAASWPDGRLLDLECIRRNQTGTTGGGLTRSPTGEGSPLPGFSNPRIPVSETLPFLCADATDSLVGCASAQAKGGIHR